MVKSRVSGNFLPEYVTLGKLFNLAMSGFFIYQIEIIVATSGSCYKGLLNYMKIT